jgi:hypothetical protein
LSLIFSIQRYNEFVFIGSFGDGGKWKLNISIIIFFRRVERFHYPSSLFSTHLLDIFLNDLVGCLSLDFREKLLELGLLGLFSFGLFWG